MEDRFRVLVADSSRNVRDFLRRELLLSDYETRTSGDAREVLSLVGRNGQLDLLILDPDMPLLDVDRLRGMLEDRLPPLPMILYGFSEESVSPALRACACAFVERCGDLELLQHTVRRVLRAHYPQRYTRREASAGSPPGSWNGSEPPKLRSP